MRAEQRGRGVIIYEKETEDYLREDLERSARLYAQSFDDLTAAQMPNLFPQWRVGAEYAAGVRITNGKGNLYKVAQSHTSQEDWPPDGTPALYIPLGVTVDNPDAVPDWRQPTGAHDAYAKGDRVKFGGKVYESLLDGNAFSPGDYPAGWAEVG